MEDVAAPVVADTDLVIDWLRDHGPGADAIDRWLMQDRLLLTAVTAFELRVGGDFADRGDEIGALLIGRTLPLDLEASLHAGEIFTTLQSRGVGIGLPDTLLAGICRRHEVPLATRNRRHFDRVSGLTLADLSE